MNSLKPIPIKEIAMKTGINVGGYQYKTYQTGPVWQLYLHPIGGYVQLRHNDTATTYYVSLSLTEAVEGYAEPQSNAPSNGVDAVSTFLPESQGLVSNQNRVSVAEPQVTASQTAFDLGGPSEADKRAKDAHFGIDRETNEATPVSSGETRLDHSLPSEQIAELAPPVKKKRGRPRKVRPEETV